MRELRGSAREHRALAQNPDPDNKPPDKKHETAETNRLKKNSRSFPNADLQDPKLGLQEPQTSSSSVV